ncbi:MAG TPA: ABC transporter permease [Clostridiaceae bacterium]
MKFLKSALSFTKLEFKALKFYPSSFVLSVIQSFVNMGIWLFVSLFLKQYAKNALSGYNGDFVSYMVIGVIFFQNAGSILTLPFQSLSTAFWDKRLEIYNSSGSGIWAFLTGKFIWTFVYNLIIQLGILIFAIFVIGIKVNSSISIVSVIVFYLLFILTCFGIGLIGASNFFYLEVKQGREPITWLIDVLARIFSGVYYPITVIPISIRFISYFIPHTYALQGIRLIMMNGYTLSNPNILRYTCIMMIFCVVTVFLGIILLNRALIKAQRGNGVGMVV